MRLPFLGMRQAGHYRHDDNLRAEVLDRIAEQLNAIDGPIVLLAPVWARWSRSMRCTFVTFMFSCSLVSDHRWEFRDFWGKAWQDPATFPYDRLGSWLNIVNVNDPVTWKRGATASRKLSIPTSALGTESRGPMNYHDAATYTSAEILARGRCSDVGSVGVAIAWRRARL